MTGGEWEYGVEHAWDDGHTYVTGFGNEKAARAFVASHSGQSWHPRPTRVMRRVVGEWQAVEAEAVA